MEDPKRQPSRIGRSSQRKDPTRSASRRPNPQPPVSAGRPSNSQARRRTRARRRAFLLLISIVASVLLLTGGIIWILHNNNPSSASISHSTAPSDRKNITIAQTESTVPFTKMITFSADPAKPLYGRLIFLDPGHGGSDSGCSYPKNTPTLLESNLNLLIADETKTALEAQGATVIMLRTDDSWVSLYTRISLVHLYCIQYADQIKEDTLTAVQKSRLITELSDVIQINSDTVDTGGMGIMAGTGVGDELALLMSLEKNFTDVLYLSIHINSNPQTSLHGTQIYYVTDESVIQSEKDLLANDPNYENNENFPNRAEYYGRDNSRNEAFAQSLYDAVTSASPQLKTNSESVVADNYAVLREHNLTSALIEVGFITNKNDRSLLSDETSVRQIASGIAAGCVNFFAGKS